MEGMSVVATVVVLRVGGQPRRRDLCSLYRPISKGSIYSHAVVVGVATAAAAGRTDLNRKFLMRRRRIRSTAPRARAP